MPATRKRPTAREEEWPRERLSGEPAHEAWRLLFSVIKGLQEFWPSVAADFDVPLVQFRVLLEIGPMEPVPMRRIAELLACDASNVTGLVDRMESRGLLERRLDERDRRIKLIAVTKAGRELRARMLARLATPPPCLEALTAAEKRALASALTPIVESLDR
jgi:DNA-binding MarR family transcriptional regulator